MRSLAGRIRQLGVLLAASSLLFTTTCKILAATAAAEGQLQVSPEVAKPNFTLRDLEDARHDLRQQAGRVVLVHFFATWCEPCREELSSLSRLVQSRPSEHFSVLAVNVAEVPVRVRRFLEATPVPVLLDADRAVTRAWAVNALPTTFVLDRHLAVRLFVEGDLEWTRSDVVAALDQIGTAHAK